MQKFQNWKNGLNVQLFVDTVYFKIFLIPNDLSIEFISGRNHHFLRKSAN